MSARSSLPQDWSAALDSVLVAANSSRPLSRLRTLDIPERFPITSCEDDCTCAKSAGQKKAARALAGVLAVVVIRAGISHGYKNFEHVVEDTQFLRYRMNCGEEIRSSIFHVIGLFFCLTMAERERCLALCARIGKLTIADLHRMAMAAVQGLGSNNLLADLIAEAVSE